MKTRVYLDNCCFNRPFDDPATPLILLESDAKLHIQKQIVDKKIELAWSYVLEHENAANPYEDQRRSIAQWQRLAVIDVDEDEEVIGWAVAIMKLGIRNMDALHIACAIRAKCRYFLTVDKKILKKQIKGITLLNPMSYVQEAEG
jgi:predicted nucleic acid-binding protein